MHLVPVYCHYTAFAVLCDICVTFNGKDLLQYYSSFDMDATIIYY